VNEVQLVRGKRNQVSDLEKLGQEGVSLPNAMTWWLK